MTNSDNYIYIPSWMFDIPGLNIRELLALAIIYGFSKNRESCFLGTLKYLASYIKSSSRTAFTVLKSLSDKGLIIKKSYVNNGVIFTEYKANFEKLKAFGVIESKLNTPVEIKDNTKPAPDIAPAPIKEKVAKKSAPKKALNPIDESDIFEEYAKEDKELLNKLKDFEQFRKDIKAPLTTLAKKQLVNKLERECIDRSERIEVLGESILKNWKGIFPNSLPSRKKAKKSEQRDSKSQAYDYSLAGLIPGVDFLE